MLRILEGISQLISKHPINEDPALSEVPPPYRIQFSNNMPCVSDHTQVANEAVIHLRRKLALYPGRMSGTTGLAFCNAVDPEKVHSISVSFVKNTPEGEIYLASVSKTHPTPPPGPRVRI